MSIAEALRDAARRLVQTNDTARLDAELLMAHALGISRSELLLRRMHDAPPAAFAELIARRAAHEPVAYIIGKQEFRGLDLLVTRDVLIPRGDSETLVQAALDAAPGALLVLDCGTGSGALLLALLAELPGASGIGIDSAPGALSVAKANAARLGMAERASLRLADWKSPGWADDLGQFDLVIANPPYVETGAELAPDVRGFEPHGALFSGPDGLDDYRCLVPQLRGLLRQGGIAALEIGASQGEAVTCIAEGEGFTVTLVRDLADRARVVILR